MSLEKVYLSDSGPKVSPAIYSFWRWDAQGSFGVSDMEALVNLCLELEINSFDHADYYGGYQCETLFGKVLANRSVQREDLVLFSKCGVRIPHPTQPDVRVEHLNTSAAHITASVEASLKNLNTDYLDIFLVDQLDHLSQVEETALALERIRNSGKVRHIGVANLSVFQHQMLSSFLRVPIVTNHIQLNLLETGALENGQLDYIRQKYMRALAASPLADGNIQNSQDPQALRVRRALESLSEKYNADIESIAVAWIVKLGALPLVGTTQHDRIRRIAAAFEVALDHQDWYLLYQASKG